MSYAGSAREQRVIRVWDLLVRTFHWSVVVAFFVAYFTEDDLLTLHVWAGYAIGGLLVLRVFWGLAGPRHARFSDFIYSPATVLRYARDLVAFRARRYLGHSPAGGAMILALMIGLAATVWTGVEFYADSEGLGPLAVASSAIAGPPQVSTTIESRQLVMASENDLESVKPDNRKHESSWEDLHESLANLTLVLVLLHIGGVVLASIAHHENLVRAMVTGVKRAEE